MTTEPMDLLDMGAFGWKKQPAELVTACHRLSSLPAEPTAVIRGLPRFVSPRDTSYRNPPSWKVQRIFGPYSIYIAHIARTRGTVRRVLPLKRDPPLEGP